MPYVVDVNNASAPLNTDDAAQAAEELRAIKGKLNNVDAVADAALASAASKANAGGNTNITDLTGLTGAVKQASFTFALLPAGTNGKICYCSNGRKVGEGAAAGTGVIVYYSNGQWRTFAADAIVTV